MTTTAMTVLGFCIIFIATTAGAALVFFFKGEMSGKLNTLFLGFASGVMVAASVWSLLIPSIEGAEETYGSLSFFACGNRFSARRGISRAHRQARTAPS